MCTGGAGDQNPTPAFSERPALHLNHSRPYMSEVISINYNATLDDCGRHPELQLEKLKRIPNIS